jgi:hypothetical protein|tara:strand:+ start:174 stop:500 length:327 start_codon:yes stop_codon:yes gene_type:complete
MKTLNQVKSGKVVKFGYDKGNNTPYFGKVVEQRDLEESPLSRDTIAKNPMLERSQYLTTVALAGDGKSGKTDYSAHYGQFYDGRALTVKNVGLFRRLLMFLSGVRYGL